MEKLVIWIACLFISFDCFSQNKNIQYIELRASIDLLGNINISPLSTNKRNNNITDSLLHVEEQKINDIIGKFKSPVKILNNLSKIEWYLVSCTYISKDDFGRPNTPFLLYYLTRDLK